TAASRRPGAEAAALPLDMTMIAVVGLLLVTENALVGRAFRPDFDVLRPVTMATGVLLLAIGNYLGKARRNAVFGLRTPWTLADATVWDRTHRFTGAGMVLGGVLLIALGFLLHDSVALGLAIGVCTAVPLLAGVARSAGLRRTQPHG
ncbi:MAG TPA: SdpI family protein, partial [Phenylobacterium sp.]